MRAPMLVLVMLAVSLGCASFALARSEAPSGAGADSTESYWGSIPDDTSSRAAFTRASLRWTRPPA